MADANKMIASTLFRIWLFEVKRVDSELKPGSFTRYEESYRNDVRDSEFASIRVSDITSLHVQRYLNAMLNDGKTYSRIKNTYKVVKMFLRYCVQEGYIRKDPCANITVPGAAHEQSEIEIFTDEDVQKLKNSLVGHRLRFLFLLALGTGLRQGELLALLYCDIEGGIIKVTRSLSYVTHIAADGCRHNALEIQTPKSKDSIRDIPMPAALMPELSAHKQRQAAERLAAERLAAERLAAGLGKNSEDRSYFYHRNRRVHRTRELKENLCKSFEKAGIEYKKFHCLRHTYATNLIKRGADVKTLQKLTGHSDISITMIYLHPDMNTKVKAADSINELFV